MPEIGRDQTAKRVADILGLSQNTLEYGTVLASLANVNPDDKYRKKVELLAPSATLLSD
jgi:hypothetical protein